MKMLDQNNRRSAQRTHWAWLLPILALAPLSMAAKGCSNDGVVGDDCPTAADCMNGTAGSTGQAGTGNGGGKTCGGLLGVLCGKSEFCSFAPEAMCGVADQTGTCQVKPEACDTVYDPVCGCDGMTYGNACSANGAGQTVASEGACGADPDPGSGDVCGGLQVLTCADGEYCNFPASAMCGSGDQTGKCATMPDGCTKEYAPVCGCDEMTYGNACSAAQAGISVAHTGECATTPDGPCGGRSNATCGADQYCYYTPEAMCGRADAQGKCTDIPKNSACDAVYDPVCGCDGMTYGNDCAATIAGVSVDYAGACGKDPTGAVCGGITGAGCDAGEFCDFAIADKCGAGDMTATCQTVPKVCTDQSDPVCGCDGKPYANTCEANAKGHAVLNKGACPK